MVLSPKFVNSHSHLEYFDLMGAISEDGFWAWLGSLTQRKHERDPVVVREMIRDAAKLNIETGVWAIGEWSDWEGSDDAMSELGLHGLIFQEVITFREWSSPLNKLAEVRERAAKNTNPTYVTPHAPYTVAPEVIVEIASTGEPMSIHAAETTEENDFYLTGGGPIANAYAAAGIEVEPPGKTSVGYLDGLGALHANTQLVHLCAASLEDVEVIAARGCSVAHCPRSNAALGCPVAEIGTMLDLGIAVGLGLDSAASSGRIDIFAEMRCAVKMSRAAKRPLTPQEVWTMATSTESIPGLDENEVKVGASPHLMLIDSKPDFDALIAASPHHIRKTPEIL